MTAVSPTPRPRPAGQLEGGATVRRPCPLTLDDIADQRAYERERDEFRRQVIAAKKLRRVTIGPVVTLTFESRLTMRFQVQEMARAERMVTDEQIQHELDVYNRLLPARRGAVGHPVPGAHQRRGAADLAAAPGRDGARRQFRIGDRAGAAWCAVPEHAPVQPDPGGDHLGRALHTVPRSPTTRSPTSPPGR